MFVLFLLTVHNASYSWW